MRPPRIKMAPSAILSTFALVLLTSSPGVDAFWRLLCRGTLGTARIDPIVNYGAIAPHAHNIAGASNFGFFTDAADLTVSNCTSCNVMQDRSAYWTPALYFRHDNGSYELVPTTGGMIVYYFNNNISPVDSPVPAGQLTAFPPGFRMVAGNTSLRDFPYPTPDPPQSDWTANDTTQAALAAKSTGFNCLNYSAPAEGSMDYHYLRNKTFLDAQCLDGVRFELMFPSCWDGKSLDSEDHSSHILYPELRMSGDCPDGFNVRTPVLFYETIWLTNNFVNYSGIFVISNGDTEGYGYHGDFYSGWNQTFLQEAVMTCTNSSGAVEDCPLFDLQDDSDSTSCSMAMPHELQDEDCQGPIPALPGNMPIFTGPELAEKMEGTPITGKTKSRAPTVLPANSTFAPDTAGSYPPTAITSPTSNSTPAPASETPTPNAASATSTPDSVSAVSSPIVTSAPDTNTSDVPEIISTSTYTSGGLEVHLILYEETVTVTQGAAPNRRHFHNHAHAHGRR